MNRMFRPEEHVYEMIFGDSEAAVVVLAVVECLASSFLLEKSQSAVGTTILEDVLPFSRLHTFYYASGYGRANEGCV